jgi:hypothetical protein
MIDSMKQAHEIKIPPQPLPFPSIQIELKIKAKVEEGVAARKRSYNLH